MSNRNQLSQLNDDELLAGLSGLVRRCNELTAEMLAHLVEVNARALYAELGFPTLFAYCVESLGLSEGAAGRRCIAARVCRDFPEASEMVARGDLHLSALCAVAKHVTAANAEELLSACQRKSRRQVDELLAVRFPRSALKEMIRRLPGGEARAAMEPLSAERHGVQFTADPELFELIQRALALGGHQSAKGLPEMMKRALRLYVEHEEKRRFGVGRKARKATARAEPQAVAGAVAAEAATSEVRAESAPPGGAIGSPYIRAEVRREVYVRDGGRCTFVAQDGRRCGSRVWLENDHVTPRACGGASDAGNLRLRCRAHNLLHARQCFGALHVAAKVAAKVPARRQQSAQRGGRADAA